MKDDDRMTVKDMQQTIGISQTAMLYHLSLLKNSGLVKSERDGHFMYYYLLDTHAICIIELACECVFNKIR